MKECPICHALAFDDAIQCFGCLYRFEEPVGKGQRELAQNDRPESHPVQFILSLVPKAEGDRLSWQCSVRAVEERVS